MEVLQAAEILFFAIPTKTACPRVTFELLYSRRISAHVNGEYNHFQFEGKVGWPGYIAVDTNGTIKLQLPKRTIGNWSEPVKQAELPESMRNFPIPERELFPFTVENIRFFSNPDVCEMTISSVEKQYSYIHPGQYLRVCLRMRGRRNKRPYYPTIQLPFHNLTYPNPHATDFHSTGRKLRFLISDYGHDDKLQKILCHETPINKTVYVTPPGGSFCPSFIEGHDTIQVLCETIGIGPALSVILYALQMNPKTKVDLYYFNHEEKDILYKYELDQMKQRESRFNVTYVLKKARKGWAGWKGAVELTYIQTFLPKWSENDKRYSIAAGQRQFVFPLSSWMMEHFDYPNRSIYRFMTY